MQIYYLLIFNKNMQNIANSPKMIYQFLIIYLNIKYSDFIYLNVKQEINKKED